MSQMNDDKETIERHVIAKGDLAALKVLVDRGVISEKVAAIMTIEVKEKEQVITIRRGGKYRILD